jgi:hypothetical protein
MNPLSMVFYTIISCNAMNNGTGLPICQEFEPMATTYKDCKEAVDSGAGVAAFILAHPEEVHPYSMKPYAVCMEHNQVQ